jgi:hypothetical protein
MIGQSNSRKIFAIAQKILFYGVLTCLVFFLIVYAYACWNIASGIREISAKATQQYPGDRVEALIAYMQPEKHGLRERNRAVWALGQIGDKRALSVLEKYRGQNAEKAIECPEE